MTVTACPDVSAAGWLERSPQPWHRLVALGPAGFAAYARLRFIPDPSADGQSESDVEADDDGAGETDQLRTATTALVPHTRTPDDCLFALWDGWGFTASAPVLRLPNRDYFLFQGPATALGDPEQWEGLLHPRPGRSTWWPDPAFVWPRDRAWCLVRDVDPHYAGIGASAGAIADVLDLANLDVVVADPTEDPLHHV